MTRANPGSDKPSKVYEKEKIRRLAEDDYVEAASRHQISESDLEAATGRKVRSSEAEGRDDSIIKSLARATQEDANYLRVRLAALSDTELRKVSEAAGIELDDGFADRGGRDRLIDEIIKRNVVPASSGF